MSTAAFDQTDATRLVDTVETSLADHKAEDLVRIDLAGKTDFADAMVIASGQSARHVGALADHVVEALKDLGYRPAVEGVPQCDWVLIDAGDVVVHLFRPEVRAFYNLEKMWGVPRTGPGAFAGMPAPPPPLMMAASP
ncbi:ribosome silencing factor [Roseospira navarrensis]|uniref:Ribosomal silencing factor RsfS n=1 Tax=Roseospira navarrensis TaxID=140058 RepID=A0A7X2D1Q2_9PROT|nr:ribosome silencing factor [Roseospira navarrensis]